MAHHAFFVEADATSGIEVGRAYVERELGMSAESNPDLILLSYSLFSVEHARALGELASQGALQGNTKVIIVSVERLFHEAQNALLKLFEEPPEGTVLVLVLPSADMLLPTLRSRLLPLPSMGTRGEARGASQHIQEILVAKPSEREKLIEKLLERAKSDSDEVKQGARKEALELLQSLSKTCYESLRKRDDTEMRAFADDVERFMPILYQRSAPLKLIFEHLLLVWPPSLH